MPPVLSRRSLAGLAVLAVPAIGKAQGEWPNRPITWIVPYPPGGPSDTAARPTAQKLAEILGQPIVIENRPGAGGTLGAEVVARARPDGHTFLVFPTAVLTISPHVLSLPFDVATAFTPIAMLTLSHGLVAAHPSVPFRDIPGLIAYGKAHPNELRFGSAGNGTITQLSGEMFAHAAGIQLEHIPYRGSVPALTDLIAGRVQLQFDAVGMPAVKDGRIIALATIGETRNPQIPDVPTLREHGLQEAETLAWFGLAGPAALPRPIVDKLTEGLGRALAAPETAAAMAQLSMMPRFEPGEAFADRIRSERERYGVAVRRTGARIQ